MKKDNKQKEAINPDARYTVGPQSVSFERILLYDGKSNNGFYPPAEGSKETLDIRSYKGGEVA